MVDARHGRGVVVGDGATQYNTYHLPRIDASALPQPEEVGPQARWTVPHPRAPVFVGRDEILARLRETFTAGTAGQCLVGLGGVGKSRVAVQYAYAFRDAYPAGVWWISAEDAVTLSGGLAGLTRSLSAAWQAMPDEPAADWAVTWLRRWPGWLLILDDVTDPAEVAGLLGRLAGAPGDLLVTSRRDIVWEDGGLATVPLGVLAPPAAAELLLARTGQDDRAAADSLAAEVGFLPLALEQAAAYVRHAATTLGRYLIRLREHPAPLFAAKAPGLSAAPAVARVWDLTLDALRETDPLALPLLALLSWLAPEDVPRDLLDALTTGEETAVLLASYSMVTLTADSIGVHRLVQAVIRAATVEAEAPAGRVPARDGAVELMLRSLPGDPMRDVDDWPRWRRLMPHIAALAGWEAADAGLDGQLGLLLNEAGQFELSQRNAEAAADLLTRALRLTTAAFGAGHPYVAIRLNNLAGAHNLAGRSAEAADLARRALEITEASAGADHPDMIIRLGTLGAILLDLDRPDEALALHERALALAERGPGPDPLLLARTLVNIGSCHRGGGRPADAEAATRRALALTETALGPDHPEVADRLASLASMCRALDRPEQALPHELRALAVVEARLPAGHPGVADRLDQLGVTYLRLDRPADARPVLERAAAIVDAAPYTEPRLRARVRANLAGSLHLDARSHLSRGDTDEAVALQQRALRIARAAHGPADPRLAVHLILLADAYTVQGRYGDALHLYRRALRAAEAPDADHPSLVPLLHTLGGAERLGGDERAALAAYERAVRIVETHHGPGHADLAEPLGCAAVGYHRLGRHEEALAAAARATTIAARDLPPGNRVSTAMRDLTARIRALGA